MLISLASLDQQNMRQPQAQNTPSRSSPPVVPSRSMHNFLSISQSTHRLPGYNEDFSTLIGLGTSSTNPDGLGNFIHFYDLENTSTVGLWKFLRCDSRAHTHQGPGNFTLQVPLPKSSFNGAGNYIIKAAVTNAVGVGFRTLTIGLLNCWG